MGDINDLKEDVKYIREDIINMKALILNNIIKAEKLEKASISNKHELKDVLAEIERIDLGDAIYTIELDRDRLKEILSKYFT
ncbi:MAG: hypothetical protein GY853_06580 [PVC group bacterium]|nr:hypothetical protein [PVC group bacterium]